MSPEWKNGTSIERFIDGVGYKAFVVHRGTVPTTLAYIRYLDDGKEELEVPIDECKIIPSPSNEVEEPHEASAAMTDCSHDSYHGVKNTAASFAMEEDTELKNSESNSSGSDNNAVMPSSKAENIEPQESGMNDAPKETSDTLPDQQEQASQQSSPVELPLIGPCGVCGVQTQYRCARCGTAFFCNRAHQRQGWSTAPIVVTPQESCTDAKSGEGPSAATGPEPFGHSARCVARPRGPLRSALNNPNLPSWASSSGTTTMSTVGNNNLHSSSSNDDLSIGAKHPPPKKELSTAMRRATEWDASRRGGCSSFLSSSGSSAGWVDAAAEATMERASKQRDLASYTQRPHNASFDSGSSGGSGAGSGSSTAGSTAGLPTESSHPGGSTIEPLAASGAASLSPPRNNIDDNNSANSNNGGFVSPMSAFGPLATDPFTTPPRTKNRVTQAASALPGVGGGYDNAMARASSSSLERPAMAPPQTGGGGGSGGAMQAAQVQQLMDVGVCPDEAAAAKALNQCGGSVEQAVEWLLEGGLEKMEYADNDNVGVGYAPSSLSRAVNSMHFDDSDFQDVGGGSSYSNHDCSMSALSVASLAFHDQQMRHPRATRFNNNGGGGGTGVRGSGSGVQNDHDDDDDDVDSLGGAGSVGAHDGDDSAFGEYDTGAHWTEGNSGAASYSKGASEPPLPPPQRPVTPDTTCDGHGAGGGGSGNGGGVKNDKKRSHSHASWVDDSCFVAEFPLTVTRGVSSGPPWHRSLLLYVYRVQSTSTDDATTAASMSASAASGSTTSDLSDLLLVIDELPLGSNVVGGGTRSSGVSIRHGGIDALAPSGGGAAVPPSEGVRRLALLLNKSEVTTLSRVHLPGTRQPGDWAPSQGETWLSPANIRPLAHALASTFLEARADSMNSFASTPFSSSSSASSSSAPQASTIGPGDRPPAGANDALRMQYALCVPNTGRIVARSVQVCTNHPDSSQTTEGAGVDIGTNSSAAACYDAARDAMFARSDEEETGEEESTVFELASKQRVHPFSFSRDEIEGFGDVAGSKSALRENHFRPIDSEDPFRQVQFDPAMAHYLEMRRSEMVHSVLGGDDQGMQDTKRRSPSPPPQVADEEKVAMLMAMGFPDDLARATLLEHRNDVEAAAEALLG